MHYYQLVSEWCLFFSHSIKIQGNEPKFIFYSDLLTTLSTSIVDSIIYKLYFYKY